MIIMFFDRFSSKNKLGSDLNKNRILAAKSIAEDAVKEIKKGNIKDAKRDLETAIGYLNEVE